MVKGFRDFLMRGNVVDLAVAVVIGAAFGAVVAAFATDFVGGIIGAIGGTPDFGNAGFNANGGRIVIGSTINALINFVIVAAVVYFVLIFPMAKLQERNDRRKGILPEEPAETDVDILHDIRDLLRAQAPGTGAAGTALPGSTPRL